MATERLRLVSWNTCGLKTRSKHDKVPQELTRLKASIVFLQETHTGRDDKEIFKNFPGWKSYFTVYDRKCRGVAILIKDDLPFKCICHDEDYQGGFIVLFCQINGHTFTLVNVYKYKSGTEMLNRLALYLQQTVSGTLVIGGDFNGVLGPMDRNNPRKVAKPNKELLNFINSLSVCDVWPFFRKDQGFTYTQNDSSSRIDMFFMLQRDMAYVEGIDVKNSSISDHQPLVLELKLEEDSEPLQDEIKAVSKMCREYDIIRPLFNKKRKISSTVILMAINNLSVYCKGTINEDVIKTYKSKCLQKTEELKLLFNQMLRMDPIPERLKCKCGHNTSSNPSAVHLIFSRVIGKYVKFKHAKCCEESRGTLHVRLFIKLKRPATLEEIKMKRKFLKRILKHQHKHLKMIPKLLVDCESNRYKRLMANCPLTETVLTLALKYLAGQLTEVFHSVTQIGLTLLVCGERNESRIRRLSKGFKRKAGLELELIYPDE